MRIVIILKKDAVANVVLNKLLKYTQLQTAFNVNNIALVNGRPRLLNLKQLIVILLNTVMKLLSAGANLNWMKLKRKAYSGRITYSA